MIVADRPDRKSGRLLAVNADGGIRHLRRAELFLLFETGDVVIANDAATLPASLLGTHVASDGPIEIRLAAWIEVHDPTRFLAVAFGAGDYRTPTEKREQPPPISPGDRLALGPMVAEVKRLLDHPRLMELHFLDDRKAVIEGLARHGKPIQYAHVPAPVALWDVWTNLAAVPVAFEPPSAGFALNWSQLAEWRQRGVELATLTHSAGLSSTGDLALDRRLPFDEPYEIPARTAAVINRAKADGRRIIAIGTTVVRALESAVNINGMVHAVTGVAHIRIGGKTQLRVVDAIVTGVHQPSDSHFELLRAFADENKLDGIAAAATDFRYRMHEFGDSVLIERR